MDLLECREDLLYNDMTSFYFDKYYYMKVVSKIINH